MMDCMGFIGRGNWSSEKIRFEFCSDKSYRLL